MNFKIIERDSRGKKLGIKPLEREETNNEFTLIERYITEEEICKQKEESQTAKLKKKIK